MTTAQDGGKVVSPTHISYHVFTCFPVCILKYVIIYVQKPYFHSNTGLVLDTPECVDSLRLTLSCFDGLHSAATICPSIQFYSRVCLVCFMACGVKAKLFRTHDLTQPDRWPYASYIYFVWFQCSSGWCSWSRSLIILCSRKDRGLRLTVSTVFEYSPVRNFNTLQIFRYCFVH